MRNGFSLPVKSTPISPYALHPICWTSMVYYLYRALFYLQSETDRRAVRFREKFCQSAISGHSGLDHTYTPVHNGGVPFRQRQTHAAYIGSAGAAVDLLQHCVQIALGGAHFINNAAALVLDLPALDHIAGLEAPEDRQVQLWHSAIGAAAASLPEVVK